MLYQNNSQLKFHIHLDLLFDNGSRKKGTLDIGDYFLMKFRYDGNTLLRAVKIVNITPVILQTDPISYTATLLVDCSTKFSADRLKVAMKDILNFRRVDKDFIDALAPDYKVTEEMVNADAIPCTPEELYMRPGMDTAGMDQARLLR